MTYGYCVYHELECDYKGSCVDCSHNTVEDTEWFRQDEKQEKCADTIIEADKLPNNELENPFNDSRFGG